MTMEVGQRYRVTWKHPKARRRKMAEGVYLGLRGDYYSFEARAGRILLVPRTYSVRWHSLTPGLV